MNDTGKFYALRLFGTGPYFQRDGWDYDRTTNDPWKAKVYRTRAGAERRAAHGTMNPSYKVVEVYR